MKNASRRVLSDIEEAQIAFGLRLGNSERVIKKTLQELCNLYEAGRRLRDATDIRQLIHSHMASTATLLRRWSLKSLGLIGSRDDTHRIVERLRLEQDLEAQTWGAAALLRNADDRSVKEVCNEAGLDGTTALGLAARLYAPERWLRLYPDPVVVSLDDDELTLKWAIFLVGYNRAPDDMFHAHHANPIFIGELNRHPIPEISEYSIWAMWERAEFGVRNLTIPLEEVDGRPDNVRKWLYRLMLKAPAETGLDADALDQLRGRETSSPAREGLALGLTVDVGMNFDSVLIDWFYEETDPQIREILLVAIARRSEGNAEFEELIATTYSKAAPDSLTRRRLLAATIQKPVHQRLRKIEADTLLFTQGMLEFYTPNVVIFGGADMSTKNIHTSFSAGGDIKGQVLSGGDVISSANHAVQGLDNSRMNDQKVLSEVIAFLDKIRPDQPARSNVAEAVKIVASDPKKENKVNLLTVLKGVGRGALLALEHASELEHIVERVGDWAA